MRRSGSSSRRAREFPSHTTSASAETADDGLYIDPDAATAQRSFAELTSHGTLACLAHLVHRALVASTRGEDVLIGQVEPEPLGAPDVGDQSAASRLTVRLVALGRKLTADADVVFVRVGRGIEVFSLGRGGRTL